MQTAMANIRALNKNRHFQKVIEFTVKKLAENPDQPIRVSTRVAKHILIQYEPLLSKGKWHSVLVRNIGAGVKELYLKEKI